MKLSKSVRALSLLAVLLPAFAQNNASLNGVVTDSSGAAVPAASVTVLNQATQIVSKATVSAQAEFQVLYLPIGAYTVTCEAPGFKRFERVVRLTAGQAGYLPIQMEVGSASESVTVTTEAPLLEATKADRGLTVDNRQVTEIPITGRNAMMLAATIPGVQYAGGSQRPFDNGGNANWSINGGATQYNDFQLDGAPNNGLNLAAYVPSTDAVEEVKVVANSYDAEYGRTGGGIISMTMKSGTNDLHGSGYYFGRRTGWQANSYGNNALGLPRAINTVDQYGFVVGGPVWLPKIYNGRNRTFFMANFEHYNDSQPWTINASIAPPEFLKGDFSKLADGQGRKITIYDPSTGGNVNGVWTRQPFAGNIIPANQISPVAQKILSYYTTPTRPNAPGAAYTNGNVYLSDSMQNPYHSLVFKIDENLGSRHRVFFRHANSWFRQDSVNGSNGTNSATGEAVQFLYRLNEADALNWTSTLTPTTILNIRASFNQFQEYRDLPPNSGLDLTAALGLNASVIKQLPAPDFFGIYNFTGYTKLGNIGSRGTTNTTAFQPQVSMVRGAHTLKAGFEARWVQFANRSLNQWGMNANSTLTQQNYLQGDSLSGNSIASFLLGGASASATYPAAPYVSAPYYAFYFQDDWRVSRKLTLNLGLRDDIFAGTRERFDRLNTGFNTTATNPVDALIDRTQFPGFPTLAGGLQFANVNGQPRSLWSSSWKNLQPRVGIAYQITSKLVFRGGWGRNFITPNYTTQTQFLGFSNTSSNSASPDNGRTLTPGFFDNPFPTGVALPPGASAGLETYLGQGFNYVNTEFHPSHVNQFSAGFQYLLPLKSVLDISYVGSRSADLISVLPANQPSLAVRQRCNWAEGGNPAWCNTSVPNPFKGLAPFAGSSYYTASTLTNDQLAAPFPQFGALNQVGRNDDRMWFNSMQVIWQTRRWKNLNANVNYTWSKQMMTGYNANYLTSGADFLDVQQRILARGIYEGDQTHRFKVSVVYDLPFGKGQPLLKGAGPWVNRLVNGWQIAPLLTWNSGVPWVLPGNVILLGDQHISNIDYSAQTVTGMKNCVSQWNTNGTITLLPASAAAGCSSPTWIIAPQYSPRYTQYLDSGLRLHTTPNLDISMSKITRITERASLQLRLEAYNATNTQNSAGSSFSNSPTSTTFGQFLRTGGAVGPRAIQLGAKIIW